MVPAMARAAVSAVSSSMRSTMSGEICSIVKPGGGRLPSIRICGSRCPCRAYLRSPPRPGVVALRRRVGGGSRQMLSELSPYC